MKRWTGEWRLLVAAALLGAGAYAATAGFQFVYDDVHIIQNKALLHSLANWREILRTTWWGHSLYRPFTELTFALDWTLSHGDPRWFHVVNVLLHGAVSALVYALARSGLSPVGAGAAALLFAVHPVHVEAVANVVGRAELWAALFTLVAALAYRWDGRLAARGNHTWRRAATSLASLLAVFLGMASKETAFATPGVLLLVDWWEGQRTGEGAAPTFRRHWVLWAATVALSLEWLWIRAGVLGELAGDHPAAGLEGEGLLGRAVVMAPVVLQYARLLFFPARLSADYSPNFLPVPGSFTGSVAAGLVLAAAALALAFRARQRAPALAFGIAWIAGTLLIVANLIVPTGVLLAERTLYLPSVGAVVMLGWLAAWAEANWRHAGVALAGLGVALGMARTATRIPVWSDNARFFPQLVKDAPGSYRSYWVAGAMAYDAGDPRRGEALLRRALDIYPLHPRMWETLAAQLERQQRWLEAAQAFRAVYTLDSTNLEDGARGILAFLRAGMPDSALSLAARLGAAYPDAPAYLAARAEIARAQGKLLESMTWRRRLAWADPKVWQYWFLTSQAALEVRACWEARRSLERAKALAPAEPRLAELEQRVAKSDCHA